MEEDEIFYTRFRGRFKEIDEKTFNYLKKNSEGKEWAGSVMFQDKVIIILLDDALKVIQGVMECDHDRRGSELKYLEDKYFPKEIKNIQPKKKDLIFVTSKILNEGDVIVYRDRENPNMVGKVHLKDGVAHVRGQQVTDDHPYCFKQIRLAESVKDAEKVFMSDAEGMATYHKERPELKGTFIGSVMESMTGQETKMKI